MVLRILPVLLLTLVLSDLYLYYRFMHGRRRALWARVLFFLPGTLLILAALWLTFAESHTPENMREMVAFFSCYLLVAIPKTVFMLVDLVGQAFCHLFPRARRVCTAVSSAAGLLLFAVMACGVSFGPAMLKVRHARFVSPDLPAAFDGYRIVQFTDFHLTSLQNRPAMVTKVVERIMEQQPDMIVFTGDLVSITADELDPFGEVLSRLHAPGGVYSVLGNHDYMEYARYLTRDEQAAQLAKLKARQRAMGWDLLLNDHRVVRRGADSIVVVGVENDGKPPFPERGDLAKALGDVPGFGGTKETGRVFKVLLSHDPSHWRDKVLPSTDIQLTLAGHTHGMQFMLFGWSPSQYFYPEWKHLYEQDGRALHVGLGLGGALIPFRFGAWPEINVITLQNK